MREKSGLLMATKIMVLGLVTILVWGCAMKPVTREMPSNVITATPTPSTFAPPTADAHYIQPTDYFYMDEPFGNTEWEPVYLGKMIDEASPETCNQAQFLSVAEGIYEWADWWAKTRIASRADLQTGREIIFFDAGGDDTVIFAPKTNQDARLGAWIISRITDTSELSQGFVLVGGGYKVSEKNIRIVTQ